MELTNGTVPRSVQYLGNEIVNISSEKYLKIETSPHGDDILHVQVPEGKSWEAKIHIEIIETDA